MTGVRVRGPSILGRLSDYLTKRPHVQQAAANTGWMLSDKVLRQAVNLTVGVWVARYLGPSQFGSLNYAQSFVLLFSAVAALGLDRVVVRELVREPENAGQIMGTALGLRLVAGALSIVLPIGLMEIMRPGDAGTMALVAIIALGNLFLAFDVIDLRFQSRLQSKFTIYAKGSSYLLTSAAKVVLIMMHAPLVAFAWVALADTVIGAGNMVVALRCSGQRLRGLSYSAGRAGELLRESWPLILSGISITVYMRIDQTMLGQMKGFAEVGIYAAAIRLSEVWSFVPVAIAASAFPSLIEARKVSEAAYNRRLQKLFYLMAGLAYLIAVPMTFLSGPLMSMLYGQQYAGAGLVLAIHIWGAPFMFLGVARGYWAVNEGLTRFIFATTFLGTITNVGLNLLLIPAYGPAGAAVSLVASQIIASYLSNLWYRETRPVFVMQCKALFPLGLLVHSEA